MSGTKLGIVGAGQMGAGIAQVAALAGVTVVLNDGSKELAERGRKNIGTQLGKQVEKGKLAQAAADEALARVSVAVSLEDLRDCDVIIEAATEQLAVKKELFTKLDSIVKKDAVLASNTSSISITQLAAATQRPEQVVGVHFFNPVPVMKLVELIRALQTSDATFAKVRALAESLGKTTVVAKEAPGFIVNRILLPMINEAVVVFEAGLASAEDIDTAMKLGTNQPMGPLALADFIGLDTCLAICETLQREIGDDKYRPAPLLRQYVAAGWLGKKSGRGFYRY